MTKETQSDSDTEWIEEFKRNRVRLRCTGKDCEKRSGFWTAKKFEKIYLEQINCLLCGSKHAPMMNIISQEEM